MSMLECILNYSHTGNACIFMRKLMERAWLLLGYISDGFPCIADGFVVHGMLVTSNVMVSMEAWPVDTATQ